MPVKVTLAEHVVEARAPGAKNALVVTSNAKNVNLVIEWSWAGRNGSLIVLRCKEAGSLRAEGAPC